MGGVQQSSGRAGALRSVEREDERHLVDALRTGDEAAFVLLLERYHTSLVRLAMVYVSDRAVAEEVAQETWLGVLEGIRRFEGRSSLKTWLFRILVNRARTRAMREGRTVAFSALANLDTAPYEATVDPDRFNPLDHARWPGHWSSPPADWGETPELLLLAHETRTYIDRSISVLPPSQQEVITLRDIEGLTSGEVCNVLGITETNQRVLLHRARSKVRRALERYMDHDHES
jgi:RNA polymerase sigma-70 factor (ECF subfamily)